MNEELDETDLAFLEKFKEVEKNKQDVDGLDQEGIDQWRDSDHKHAEEAPEGDHDPRHEDPVQETIELLRERAAERAAEKREQEAEEEGLDQQESETESENEPRDNPDSEADSDPEGEGDSEQENNQQECQGDCQESEDSEGESCPYCEKREQIREEAEQNPQHPIAKDKNGDDLFVGDEIRSKGDVWRDDLIEEEYVGVIMGLSDQDPTQEDGNNMLVVFRRDLAKQSWKGGFRIRGEMGWGVSSHLTTLVKDEQEQEQQQQRDRGPVLLRDKNGVDLYADDKIFVTGENMMGFPLEGIATIHAESDERQDTGVKWPCFEPNNFEPERKWNWFLNGKPVWTFTPTESLNKRQGIVKYERHDEDDEDIDNFEFEAPPENKEQKPLTKTQKARFAHICERIFRKTKLTFGSTIEEDETGPDLPGGIWDGEEVARVYTVSSRGVVYRISVSAERCD